MKVTEISSGLNGQRGAGEPPSGPLPVEAEKRRDWQAGAGAQQSWCPRAFLFLIEDSRSNMFEC